jgi:formamidopyrimidine-DNA glycosylase
VADECVTRGPPSLFPSSSPLTPADSCRILYQSRLHPATPIPSLTEENLQTLHHWIRKVPEVAVGVNADSKFFPEDWLFRWRWGKGKKHDAMAKKAKAGLKGSWDPPVEVKKEGGGDDENGGEDITPQGKDFLALVSPSPSHVM